MSGQADSQKPKAGLLGRLLGSSKKPALNKPAYYADGGALMGTVVEVEAKESGEPSGFVVETDYGERMRFPVEQFEITDRGLIYRPLWKESLAKQVEELEERIRAGETGDSLVVAQLLSLKTIDAAAIKAVKAKHPDQKGVFEAFAGMIALYRELRQRLEVLEVERIRARSDLTLHAGERLLKHSSRREFAKLVLAERRRYEICDINIKHVRKLLERLHGSPYFPSHLFPLPSENEEEADLEIPFQPTQAAPKMAELPVMETAPPQNENIAPPADPTPTPAPQPVQPPVQPKPAPRITFTPPPRPLARAPPPSPERMQASEDAKPRERIVPPSRPTPPRQALKQWQEQRSPSGPAGVSSGRRNRPMPRLGAQGGLASSLKSMVRDNEGSRAPLKTSAPGVANSLLSFVNEARSSSAAKSSGPAMVLNINS